LTTPATVYIVDMRVYYADLFNKDQTAAEMYRIVERYHEDLKNIPVVYRSKKVPFSDLTLKDAFDVIKMIPYKQDSPPVELLSRPKYIGQQNTGADCKKKSILMGSFLKVNNLPYRFVAISTMPDRRFHHVFTQTKINNSWKNLDPTYPDAIPFKNKKVTNYEVL
jgi:hypothetical protein